MKMNDAIVQKAVRPSYYEKTDYLTNYGEQVEYKEREKEYERVFEELMATDPGSPRASELSAKLRHLPVC